MKARPARAFPVPGPWPTGPVVAPRRPRVCTDMTVLIVCAAATWFMAGLHWFVQVVHYPLFGDVGPDRFLDYHRRHSERTTAVVLPAMSVELATSGWLVLDRPAGTSAALVAIGLALALSTWAATGLLAVPRHSELGAGYDVAVHRRLTAASWVRTAAWSAHGVVVAVLLAQAAG